MKDKLSVSSGVRSGVFLLLALLLAGCGWGGSAHRGKTSVSPLVHLPADQAAHLGVANEWWYVVGHMHGGGRTFGFETTAFRLSHVRLPGSSPGTPPSTLYRTDVAITDDLARRFHQRISYYFPQSASISLRTLNVRVGQVSLRGSSPASMTLRSALPGGAIKLQLVSRREAMNVGGRGYLRFANGFTYYYSLTDLATQGTIRLGSRVFRVSGFAWLDHQWGNWSWMATGGWTWMAIQLDDGLQLSAWDVHSPGSRVRGVSALLPDGRLQTLHSMSFIPLGSWRSPHTGALYPSGWRVEIPGMGIELRVEPTVRDQELVDRLTPRGSYWEGSGRVTGVYGGKPVQGYSYTELTGFIRR